MIQGSNILYHMDVDLDLDLDVGVGVDMDVGVGVAYGCIMFLFTESGP